MTVLRLAIVLLFLAAPLATSALGIAAGRESSPIDVHGAPALLGAFKQSGESRLEAQIADMLRPDSYVLRSYAAPGRPTVWLYLAAYSGGGSTGAHDPQVCYPAQGWDLREMRERTLAAGGDQSLSARLLVASQLGARELALYWFQPVARWPRSDWLEYLLRVGDRLRGRPQYVFVRLSTATGAEGNQAEQALVEMAEHLAPWLRAAMEPVPS